MSQTGNRRFWPIDVYKNKPTRQVSELANEAVIGQIWAEAVTFYLQGEKLYLDPEQEAIARKVQESHTEEDDWSSIISEYLEIQIPDHWYTLSQSDKVSFIRSQRGEFTYGDKYLSYQFIKRDKVTATEIWLECFIGDIQKLDRRTTMRIKTIMRKLEGWEEPTTKIRISGGTPVRGFVRKVNTPCLQ